MTRFILATVLTLLFSAPLMAQERFPERFPDAPSGGGSGWCPAGVCSGDLRIPDDMKLYMGDVGDDYWLMHSSAGNTLCLYSTDTNGAGLDGPIYCTTDGTDDFIIYGDTYASGDLSMSGDIYLIDNHPLYIGNDPDCWIDHNSGSSVTCLTCSDVDGIGTDGDIFCIDNGTDDMDITGKIVMGDDIDLDGNDLVDPDDIYNADPSSDIATRTLTIKAQDAFPTASVNTTGAAIYIVPGSGSLSVTIDDYNNCAGDWVRWYVAPIPATDSLVTFTEGGTWTAAVDNDTTAASLAAAIDASPGLNATSSGAVVSVSPDNDTTWSYTGTMESDATCTTIAYGLGSDIVFPGNTKLTWGDGHEYIQGSGYSNVITIGAVNTPKVGFGSRYGYFYTDLGFASGTALRKTGGNGKLIISNYANTTNTCLDVTTDAKISIYDGDCSSAAEIYVHGAITANGKVDAGNGLEIHNGTSLPATCATGEIFQDTDSDDCADTGGGDGALCLCKTTNTWVLLNNI